MPAYLAGGPISSVKFLAQKLSAHCDNHIIAGASDLQDHVLMKTVYPGLSVNRVEGVVHYTSGGFIAIFHVVKLMLKIRPDIVYINGIFSLRSVVLPLLLDLLGIYTPKKIIIAPRGMLQQGALAQKTWKKKIYLSVLRRIIKGSKYVFQATDPVESKDIVSNLSVDVSRIVEVGNIPQCPLDIISNVDLLDPIRLIFVSRISPKKNIEGLITELCKVRCNVHLDVFGPIVSGEYRLLINKLIAQLPNNVRVVINDPLHPSQVQSEIEKYNYFVLLTHGENFGHSIFESMSVGRPVIISEHTPWTDQVRAGAGYIWTRQNSLSDILEEINDLSQDGYMEQCHSAYQIANDYYKLVRNHPGYEELFSLGS